MASGLSQPTGTHIHTVTSTKTHPFLTPAVTRCPGVTTTYTCPHAQSHTSGPTLMLMGTREQQTHLTLHSQPLPGIQRQPPGGRVDHERLETSGSALPL